MDRYTFYVYLLCVVQEHIYFLYTVNGIHLYFLFSLVLIVVSVCIVNVCFFFFKLWTQWFITDFLLCPSLLWSSIPTFLLLFGLLNKICFVILFVCILPTGLSNPVCVVLYFRLDYNFQGCSWKLSHLSLPCYPPVLILEVLFH